LEIADATVGATMEVQMGSVKNIVFSGILAIAASMSTANAQDLVAGTGVDPTFSPLYVAHEAGLFKKHGVDVSLKLFASGSASVDPLVPGEVNVAMTGPARPLLTHVRAPKVTIVAQFVTQSGYTDLVGLKSIPNVEALRGKRVGYELGTTTEVFALDILGQYKMTARDINHINLQPPEALAGLQNKNLDAVFSFKPWSDRAVAAMPNDLHFVPGAEKFFSHLHIFADKEWLEKSPKNMDSMVKFLAAMKESAAYIAANKDAAAALVAKHLRMEVTAVRPLLDLNAYTLVFDQATMDLLKREVDFQVRSGRLPATFAYAPFVYTEPLRRLDASLVKYELPK
jgi:ABC-type nitrate/sulfonate/bicarbonate transport system substrate-binding protein